MMQSNADFEDMDENLDGNSSDEAEIFNPDDFKKKFAQMKMWSCKSQKCKQKQQLIRQKAIYERLCSLIDL